MEYHKIWIEQSQAAKGIRERFGTLKAMDYIVGEKFINFLGAAEEDPNFNSQVPDFVESIQQTFIPAELNIYFELIEQAPEDVRSRLVGLNPEEKEEHVFMQDTVSGAERVLRIQYAKELLLS